MRDLSIGRILLKIPELFFRLAFFVACFAIISAVAYYFGHFYLRAVYGNDARHALSLISWIARYFPKIPFWYPLQGGGVSMLWSYPSLPSILVVLVDRWTHLGIMASFQVVGFSSFLLTALGMYLFVWWRLKNQTAALISAVFYLLMPLTYAWLTDWGFYAEAISYTFFFPALIFYDLFLEGVLKGEVGLVRRLSLFLAALFGALLFNTHPFGFVALILTIGVQTLLYALIRVKEKKAKLLRFLLKAISPSILAGVSAVLLTAFVVFSFTYYKSAKPFFDKNLERDVYVVQAEQGDVESFLLQNSIPQQSLLGLGTISNDDPAFSVRNLVIPPLVWVLGLAGVLLAVVFYRKTFCYLVPGLIAFLLMVRPMALFNLIRLLLRLHAPMIDYFSNERMYLMLVRYFFPIAAAFGIAGVGRLIFEIPTFWIRFIKVKAVTFGLAVVRNLFVAVFALAAAAYLIFFAANKPEGVWGWNAARYGRWIDVRDPFGKFKPVGGEGETDAVSRLGYLRRGCTVLKEGGQSAQVCSKISSKGSSSRDKAALSEFVKECKSFTLPSPDLQLCPLVMDNKQDLWLATLSSLRDLSYWNKPSLVKPGKWRQVLFPFSAHGEFVDRMADEENLRIDVSPMLGGITMSLSAVSDMSIINLYTPTASLIRPYWGYENQVFYYEYDDEEDTASEVARWFGVKYLFVSPGADPTDKYFQKGNWESELNDNMGGPAILKFRDAPEMATWTKDRPVVLVIGSKERGVFEPVFRASTRGALPYSNAWLVEGEERIDDYSLKELEKFDIIYLFGYNYKNQKRAWGLIDSYLTGGGKVFLSTGWQFADKDWEAEETPAWFPPTSLSWTARFDKQSSYSFNLSAIDGKLDIFEFGPLEWEGVGYGVSAPESLREWAKPILSVDGVPLVAVGEYGEGRVVWSGLNLVGHMHSYDYNKSEVLFHRQLFDWLQSSDEAVDLTNSLEVTREHPDKVRFGFTKDVEKATTLYWREAAFPSWKATLVNGDKRVPVKIYYGGPRFMLMQLEDVYAGDTLILEFVPGLRYQLLIAISLATALVLLLYVVLGERIFRPFASLYKDKIVPLARRKFKSLKELEEGGY